MHRRYSIHWAGGIAAAIGVAGCASVEVSSLPCPFDANPCVPPHYDAGADGYGFPPPLDATQQEAAVTRNPLCGTVGCFPGTTPCVTTTPSDAGSQPEHVDDAAPISNADAASDSVSYRDGGSEGGPSDDGSSDGGSPVVSPDASVYDASSDAGGHDASISSDSAPAPAADGSADASVRYDAPIDVGATDEPTPPQSCIIRPMGATVVTRCVPIGAGGDGDACEDSSECGQSLACVDVDGTPTCRPFSCQVPAQCLPKSYYQVEPLRESGVTMGDVMVPVCVPTVPCELLAKPSSCKKQGQVCAIVGGEGDTTCVFPGTGKLGDPCDDPMNACGEGLVCSKLKNQCLQICHVGAGATECPGGRCEGGNRSLPPGFGICVGSSIDGG
jgi:hypothetical protein